MSKKLRALPVHLAETPIGIVLKRGCTELRIAGEGAAAVLQRILWLTTTKEFTCQEICEQFGSPMRQEVKSLIEQLIHKRVLISADNIEPPSEGPETSLDIFYWHFGESAQKVTDRLNSHHIVILGVNCISRQLATSLSASGMVNVQIVDFPLLRNLRLFNDQGQLNRSKWIAPLPLPYGEWIDKSDKKSLECFIATSDFGNHEVLRQWNRFCIEEKYRFLPVVLQDLIGYVGPFVIPGETACFECLRARENAHFEDPIRERASEETAFETQAFVGFHPSMASILGDLAAIELTKFYCGILPRWNIGSLIEVNLLASQLSVRRILKLPRCPVCSPLNTKSPVEPKKKTVSISG